MMNGYKTNLGITLLEVLLLIAVAGVAVYYSARYYQNRVASQDANAVIKTIDAIILAADKVANGSSYNVAGINTDKIQSLLTPGALNTPWGTSISVGNTILTATTFNISLPDTPPRVCQFLYNYYSDNKTVTAPECPDNSADYHILFNAAP